ncbi:unnamed protein product [Linum trigynum]|uniref:Arabinogalactan peptide 23-like n=1 Tax=Linum trigynum TaxID=586398 RepID=A0AAV2CA10_9ROSI
MAMKKICCAVVFAAASLSTVMAAETVAPAPGPSGADAAAAAGLAAGGPAAAAGGPAAGPTSAAGSALPAFGTLVGASLVSLVSYYFQ